jgi:hypothetical protein
MARTAANIKKTHYRVMHRAPATGDVPPADLAAWTALKATFTELGFCRDKTIKVEFSEGDEEVLDDGSKLKLGFNGLLEFILLQSEKADYDAYEAIENIAQDILIVDEVTNRAIYIPNALLFFGESVVSGDVEAVPAKYEAENLSSKSSFRVRFAIPTS